MNNPIQELGALGQGLWLDFIERRLLTSGGLLRLIREGVRGVTSNPAIFQAAMEGSTDYDDAIHILAHEGLTAEEIYWDLALDDIRHTADAFRPLFDRLEGQDGFVSLEVSPELARDTQGTIEQARELWRRVGRPNVLIKVPGTKEGLPAIRQLLAEGVNINITLLFGLPRYREVAEAYVEALEERARQGLPLWGVASVASFFLSRIDVLVDPLLDRKMKEGPDAQLAASLLGQVAVANARLAYQIYKEVFGSERFRRLAEQGARPQRVLWASTGTKNPEYSDTKYVEPLIGPDTVNTVPLETLKAYRDHGHPKIRIEDELDAAGKVMEDLRRVGIDIDDVTRQLEQEAIEKFDKPYRQLLKTLERKRTEALAEAEDRQSISTNGWEGKILKNLAKLAEQRFPERLWQPDASLWGGELPLATGTMGWLQVADRMKDRLIDLTAFSREIYQAGFRQVLQVGMGAGSLAAQCLVRTFNPGEQGLPLRVVDSPDPCLLRELEDTLPLGATLFLIASKSGVTLETQALMNFFYDRLYRAKGPAAGEHFVALSNPGSPLLETARARGFRRGFEDFPDVIGRYSALSYFGLLPAALMDIDPGLLVEKGMHMIKACGASVPPADNPGVQLGVTLGTLALEGLDKVTFLLSEPIQAFGRWLEHLLAESTGRAQHGLLPSADEPLGDPPVYGSDRVFVCLRLTGDHDPYFEGRMDALRKAGHPVIVIDMDEPHDLGQELVRWQVAVATAASLLRVNPFEQPSEPAIFEHVKHFLQEGKQIGAEKGPSLTEGSLRLYGLGGEGRPAQRLGQFLRQVRRNGYVAFASFLPETPEVLQMLQFIRLRLRDSLKVATLLGYGPRFHHAFGWYYRQNRPNGLLIQVTEDPSEDVKVPQESYTFGELMKAQAEADWAVLSKEPGRILRIHLASDCASGLEDLHDLWTEVLGEA